MTVTPSPQSVVVPKFGDIVENGWASEDNPTRRGFFVREFKRTGKMNPGRTWEITDGKGKFWEFKPSDIGERLAVSAAPAPLSLAGGERERVMAIIDANKYEPWTVDRAGQMADTILAALSPEAPARDDDLLPEGAISGTDDGQTVWLESHTGGAHELGVWGGLSLRFEEADGSHSIRNYVDAALTPRHEAPADDDDGPCTCCDDTGITIQTERPCACTAGIPSEAPAEGAGECGAPLTFTPFKDELREAQAALEPFAFIAERRNLSPATAVHLVHLDGTHIETVEVNAFWRARYSLSALRARSSAPEAREGEPVDDEATHYGEDCPVGMVQVAFVGCPPAQRYSDYGWKPTKSAFIELYVDGQRYRIDAGDIGQNCFDGKPRRGVHINYPIGAALGDRSINALNLSNPGADPFWSPSPATHPAAPNADKLREALTWAIAEIQGDTHYENEGQREAALDQALAALEAEGAK